MFFFPLKNKLIVPWFLAIVEQLIVLMQRLLLNKPMHLQQQRVCIVCRTKYQRKLVSWNPKKVIFHYIRLPKCNVKTIIKTYLSTEAAGIFGMLGDFNFFHHFTQRRTISCAIFTNNSDLLRAFCLLKQKKAEN